MPLLLPFPAIVQHHNSVTEMQILQIPSQSPARHPIHFLFQFIALSSENSQRYYRHRPCVPNRSRRDICLVIPKWTFFYVCTLEESEPSVNYCRFHINSLGEWDGKNCPQTTVSNIDSQKRHSIREGSISSVICMTYLSYWLLRDWWGDSFKHALMPGMCYTRSSSMPQTPVRFRILKLTFRTGMVNKSPPPIMNWLVSEGIPDQGRRFVDIDTTAVAKWMT